MSDTDWIDLGEITEEVLLAAKNGAGPLEELDSWRPQDLNDLPETPPVPPNLGQTHLVYPGKRHVFSGPPESAKTLAAYCILIQVVRNGDSAILLDFEMGAYDARQRLRELGATTEEISRISYVEPDERANVERIANLIALGPDLMVIDAAAGIYSLEGLDDNKRSDVEKISALYIRAFWRNGIATILIDHVVKDSEGRGKFAIGSERKLGGADVHMGFEVVGKQAISRGGSGKYKITTHKDRGGYLKRGHLADLNLTSNPETHMIKWAFVEPIMTTDDEGHKRFTINMERVSKLLENSFESLGVNEIKRELGGNAETVRKALNTLVDEGFVRREGGPNNTKLHSSIKVYREADDPKVQAENQPGESSESEWFSSESGLTACSGDSGESNHPLTGGGHPDSLAAPKTDPKLTGWFSDNGTLIDDDIELP